jgi:hypothetical protein
MADLQKISPYQFRSFEANAAFALPAPPGSKAQGALQKALLVRRDGQKGYGLWIRKTSIFW